MAYSCQSTKVMKSGYLVQLDHTITFDDRLEKGADAYIQKKDNINQLQVLGGPWRYAIWQTFMRADWQQRQKTKFAHLKKLEEDLNQEGDAKKQRALRRKFILDSCIGMWNPIAWLQALTCYLYTKETARQKEHKDPQTRLWLYSILHPIVSGINSAVSLLFAIPFAMIALPVTLALALLWNIGRAIAGYPTDWRGDMESAIQKSMALFNPLNHYLNRIGQAFYDFITEPIIVLKTLFKIGLILLAIYYLPHLIFNMGESSGYGFEQSFHHVTQAFNYFVYGVTWVTSYIVNDLALAMVNWLPSIDWSVGKGVCKTIGLTTFFTPLALSFVGWVCDLAYNVGESDEVDTLDVRDPSAGYLRRLHEDMRATAIVRPSVPNIVEDAMLAGEGLREQLESNRPRVPSRPSPM